LLAAPFARAGRAAFAGFVGCWGALAFVVESGVLATGVLYF
jgi:hypothetical protein